MLWMSSATWFDFLARRFRELQKMQICLSIASTPIIIILDCHIRESMALL
ncbi:hypothetical protein BS17DRAFT_823451 [Gyrodon lividus]|nr:hypothetical protein BS17DRAFT_823451 [Gyrodon lividus]